MAKVQLENGGFQDSEGHPLALGSLTMELNQDCSVTATGQVCAGIVVTVPLDANGNVSVTPPVLIWPNDQLSPVNNVYKVTGYTAEGQLAWGPNYQQVLGASPFDLNSWIPNTVANWIPTPVSLQLQTNEVNNGSQTLLDLHSGSGITLTDDRAGRVTVAGVSLQTNEVANGSQTVLDLHAGTNIALTDNGSGRVTISGGSSPLGSDSVVLVNDYLNLNSPVQPFANGEMWRTGNSGIYTVNTPPNFYGPPHIGIFPVATAASINTVVQMNLKGISALATDPGQTLISMNTYTAAWQINFIFNLLAPITLMTLLWGVMDTTQSSSFPNLPQNGIVLFYDPSVSANWIIRKYVGGVGTTLFTSAVPVTTGWHNILIQGGTANLLSWTLDGTLLTTTLSDNAFVSNNMSPGMSLQTKDANSKQLDLDLFIFGYSSGIIR